MSREKRTAQPPRPGLVEITRLPPFEAEVVAARLQASGIDAVVGPRSVYESVSFADGVPVLVPSPDASRATALLGADDELGETGPQPEPAE